MEAAEPTAGVTPASGAVLRITRTLPARPERVFGAWTDPERFRQWFGPPGGSIPSLEMDVRVGGRFRVGMKPPLGPLAHVVGSYLEVIPSRRLVYTFAWEDMPVDPGEGRVTVEFLDRGDATEVVITHELSRGRLSSTFHRFGWTSNLRTLARIV